MILDGLSLSPPSSLMFIPVPMREDCGTEAGTIDLPFDAASDLWTLADKFCEVNDVEGVLARRRLVVWMRREARDVFGTRVVGVVGGGVTERMLEETKGLEEDEDEDEDEEEKAAAEGEEEDTFTAAFTAADLNIPSRYEGVKLNTDRAMNAVNDFMSDFDSSYSQAAAGIKSTARDAAARVEEAAAAGGPTEEAIEEAKALLADRIETIKKEKMEALRKKREFMKRSDEAREEMVAGSGERLEVLKGAKERGVEETKGGDGVEEEEGEDEGEDSEDSDSDAADGRGEESKTAKTSSTARSASAAFDERMRKLGMSDDVGTREDTDEAEMEHYMMDELKENYENVRRK